MLGTKITTLRATFARIKSGEPPTAAFHKTVTRSDGKQKYISTSTPIRDERLLARAKRKLQSGDEIEVIIETRWAEEGIPTTLLDFAKAPTSQGKTLLTSKQPYV